MVGSVERGGRPLGATAVLGSGREMGRSLSVGSPVVRGICRGALSLRYRSSDTFPFAAGSSSSLRFCLWKKPSWEEGQTDRSEGRTFKKCEWLKKKFSPGYEVIIVNNKVYLHDENLLCFIVFLSNTRWQQSFAIQECSEQPDTPLRRFSGHLSCIAHSELM